MNAFQRFWQWLFGKGPTWKELLVQDILNEIAQDMDGSFRETHGKNRSPEIDTINLWVRAGLGKPYCLSALLHRLNRVLERRKLKNPVGREAGTQRFFRNAPAEFKVKFVTFTESIPLGAICIMQSRSDSSLGHAFIARETKAQGARNVMSYEYNTGADAGRDGEGAFPKLRNMAGTSGLKMLGYVDVVEWIAKANGR